MAVLWNIKKNYQKWQKAISKHKAISGFIFVISIGVVFSTITILSVNALTSPIQTDWSGGAVSTQPGSPVSINQSTTELTSQYSSIDNLISSAPGKLTLGDTLNSANWCNISNVCDSSFKYRNQIDITNPNSEKTNANVDIAVKYDSQMQSDFSDLRFTAQDGTELTYYITGKTDSQNANITVTMPTLASGITSIYMYYGKSGDVESTAGSHELIAESVQTYNSQTADKKRSASSCAVSTDKKIYCWGNNSYGQIGDDTTTSKAVPTLAQGPSGKVAKKLAASGYYNCAIYGDSGNNEDDKLYCWGSNGIGQIGDGTRTTTGKTVPTLAQGPSDKIAKQVAINDSAGTTCAIYGDSGSSNNDKIYCWGNNVNGLIGDNTIENRTVPTLAQGPSGKIAKQVSISSMNACAIYGDSANNEGDLVYCWGNNSYGQIGDNTIATIAANNKNVPTLAKGPSGKIAKQVVSFSRHIECAVYGNSADTSDDRAYCWGANDGTTTGNRLVPTKIPFSNPDTLIESISTQDGIFLTAIDQSHNAYIWGTESDAPSKLSIQAGAGTVIKSVSGNAIEHEVAEEAGYASSICAIAGTDGTTDDDRLYCNGSNDYGQLGNGTFISEPMKWAEVKIPAGLVVKSFSNISVNTVCATAGDSDNNLNDHVYCWGNNSNGRFSDDSSITKSSLPVLLDLLNTSEKLSSNQVQTGIKQYDDGAIGSLTSTVFNFDETGFFFGNGVVTINNSGSGEAGIQIRTSDQADMSSADNWDICNLLASGDKISDSSCVKIGEPYVQYRLSLSDDSTADIAALDISFGYDLDITAPSAVSSIIIKSSSTGSIVSNGQWLKTNNTWSYNGTLGNGWLGNEVSLTPDTTPVNKKPYISWGAATDENGSGIAGYCLYFGSSSDTPIFSQSSGLLDGLDGPLDTGGRCRYATANNYIDIDGLIDLDLADSAIEYFSVIPFDQSYNFAGSAKTVSYRVDRTAPSIDTIISGPTGLTNSTAVSFSWINSQVDEIGFFDIGSGVAGIKYCVYSIDRYTSEYCSNPLAWAGPGDSQGRLAGGLYNFDDVFPASSEYSSFTTSPLDTDITNNGINAFILAVVDKAGNITPVTDASDGIATFFALISQQAPSSPTNLAVSPESATNPDTATANSYSFSWDPPETYEGSVNKISYCYTFNVAISENGANCNWTSPGVTELAENSYATKQGKNTLYLMAKNEATNFDITKYTSIDFYTDTNAPGIPSNIEIMDASTKPTSTDTDGTWKLALTWEKPTFGADTIASYRILRSTDGINYSSEDDPVGRTTSTNLSYIDSGLEQNVTYYYKLVACDKANKCSVRSAAVSKAPTGHFTAPAELTIASEVSDIGTKKASITWYTNRPTDSTAVRFGTKSGESNYFPDDFGNKIQLTKHVVNLTNLQPNTKYYYTASWTDEGGTGKETEKAFTTLSAPSISEAYVDNITISGGTINLTIENASRLAVYYGDSENFGRVKTINTSTEKSNYAISISDLGDGQKYYYKINGIDADGNEYSGNTYSFVTLPRPRISNLRFQPIINGSSNATKVTWTTNVPTTSELIYGPLDKLQSEAIVSDLVTEHSVEISGLDDNSEYTLVARSRDAAGNIAVSDRQTFKTALDTRPPVISNISSEASTTEIGADGKSQIIISWETDELSSSQVEYGIGSGSTYDLKSQTDTGLTKNHIIVITGLNPSSSYHFRVVSVDASGNRQVSNSQSMLTEQSKLSVFEILINSLQSTIGWLFNSNK